MGNVKRVYVEKKAPFQGCQRLDKSVQSLFRRTVFEQLSPG